MGKIGSFFLLPVVRSSFQIVSLSFVTLFLSGCAGNYVVTESNLQETINDRLPMTANLGSSMINGAISTESVNVDIGQKDIEKINVEAFGTLSINTRFKKISDRYRCSLSGRIHYNPENAGIYLTDVTVSELELIQVSRLLPPKLYAAATQEARAQLISHLTDGPVYTVQNNSVREAYFRHKGKAIRIEPGKLVFDLTGTNRD